MVGKVFSLQELAISSVTDLYLPPITLRNVMAEKGSIHKFNYRITKTFKEFYQQETTLLGYLIKRGTTWNDLQRPETTHNEQETTRNDLQWARNDLKQGWTNFLLGARLFEHTRKRALKTKVRVLDTTRNTAFYSLLFKYHLQLSFLICFHQKFTPWGFRSLNAVLTSIIRSASKNNFHDSNVSI